VSGELGGRTIGITADRRGDDQAVMWTRLGAGVVHGPTLTTVKVPDPDLLRRRTEEIIGDPPDVLIANTGIGMRTWLDAAAAWSLDQDLLSALAHTRIAVRGPKAAGALTSAGLTPWWRCPTEQLADLVEHLRETGVDGRRVVLQLHGDDGAEVIHHLHQAGARVTTVPVYAWQPPEDPAPARRLIELTCAGTVDAVTFTAGPQVRSLLHLAGERRDELVARLDADDLIVGCIGPVCASVAEECGIHDPVVPNAWRLGSLVKAVAAALQA
jgi:uroporphyrinogen-III synthase